MCSQFSLKCSRTMATGCTTTEIQPLPVSGARGFALVVTLSLMVLLTIVAVGLLSLSAVELRVATQGHPMAAARANARLSLMIALGDLQRTMGPDGRISVPAAQSLPSAVAETSPHQQWTGVYEAWDADQGLNVRPEPKFVQWLTSSATPEEVRGRSFADSEKKTEIAMVGAGTLGTQTSPASGAVTSPALPITTAQQRGQLAWWVADESMKAHVVSGSARPAFATGAKSEPLFSANAARWPKSPWPSKPAIPGLRSATPAGPPRPTTAAICS